jgi:hypothetical protein
LTLAYGLLVVLAVVQADSAVAADSEGQQSAAGRVCGHKFEPGPIVDNHYRQPTPAEFEARMRELRALCQESAGAHHPDWFPNAAKRGKRYSSANWGMAYGSANGGTAYGFANGGKAVGSTNGVFINGNFISRGTSPAQVPLFHEED